ncbi:MAG: hypothetical protein FWD99_09470 [Oscillospiraceae bacterium]|nr:hypothetical protein [Oscillospiraceae bacterium]
MNFLQQFFQGRNGTDQLNIAMLILGFVFNLLSRFMFGNLFSAISFALLGLCLFRMISRNIPKRRRENAIFMELTKGLWARLPGPLSGGGAGQPRVKKDRANYRYFKCPSCRQPMRAPRGKGKIRITCSKCGNGFYKEV